MPVVAEGTAAAVGTDADAGAAAFVFALGVELADGLAFALALTGASAWPLLRRGRFIGEPFGSWGWMRLRDASTSSPKPNASPRGPSSDLSSAWDLSGPKMPTCRASTSALGASLDSCDGDLSPSQHVSQKGSGGYL